MAQIGSFCEKVVRLSAKMATQDYVNSLNKGPGKKRFVVSFLILLDVWNCNNYIQYTNVLYILVQNFCETARGG